jgi:polyamine oxidase
VIVGAGAAGLGAAERLHGNGLDVGDLSPEALDEGGMGGGGDVVFPNGYSEVLAELDAGYAINLETTVSSIDHGGDTVVVTTSAGTFEADAVVVTVPLGVLKAGSIAFSPALSEAKLGSIDRLGMGLLDKVYLRFDEVFWEPDVEFIGYVGPERDRYASWLNLAKYTGEPILMAFNAGSAADEIELASDEEIVADAVATLRRMYGAA